MAKKRANGEGTIRQRKDGLWEARMTVDGKVKYFYGKTQRAAMDARKANKKDLEAGLNVDAGKMTLAQWLDVWFRDYTMGIKASTAVKYETDMRLHVKPYIGSIKLSALRAPAIQRLYNQKTEDGMSPKSLRNVHGMLHKALDQAVKLGYINRNESDLCILPKNRKEEIYPLKDGEIPYFLSLIAGHEFELLYRIALFTGMRQNELLGLTWDSVDFTRGTIHIYQQLQRIKAKGQKSVLAFTSTKNGKERTIMPARQVMDLLQQIKQQQVLWAEQNRLIWNNSTNLVFTTPQGRYLSDNTVYKQFKKLAAQMGRPEVRFHDLRHPYVKHTTKNISLQKQKSQTTNSNLIVWGFCFRVLFLMPLALVGKC